MLRSRNLLQSEIQIKFFSGFCSKPKLGASSLVINKPILYGDIVSPPVRFVMMTASCLSLELEFRNIDLFLGENKLEFYKQINPLQKVPALCTRNKTICDSHAISLYLCKMSPKLELYPEYDAEAKAKVDEMLFFNASALFPLDSAIFTQYFAGKWPANREQVNDWNFLLDYMENILKKNTWLTGQKMMLSDICCAATVSSLYLLLPPDDRHSRVNEWLTKMQLLPFYNINIKGLNRLKYFVNKFNPKMTL